MLRIFKIHNILLESERDIYANYNMLYIIYVMRYYGYFTLMNSCNMPVEEHAF